MRRGKQEWPFAPRRIAGVRALAGAVVEVAWADGEASIIDLSPWVGDARAEARLRGADFFSGVKVGEHGWSIQWGEACALDSIHLQLLEAEQAGMVHTADAMRRWRARHGLTLDGAAEALGLSRRMIGYYESGQHFIPRHVGLACKGFDALHGAVRPAA